MDIITWSQLKKKADLVNGKVPSTQLPSYVDDVVEVEDFSHLPTTGESGKIYVTLDNNCSYRWSGSEYIKIGDPNMVTLDTDQTITGNKTFTGTTTLSNNASSVAINFTNQYTTAFISLVGYQYRVTAHFQPYSNNYYDLGGSGNKWKDLYLSGNLSDGTNSVSVANIVDTTSAQTITGNKTFSGTINATNISSGSSNFTFGGSYQYNFCKGWLLPQTTSAFDLGTSTYKWKDLYLSGKTYYYGSSINYILGNSGSNLTIYETNLQSPIYNFGSNVFYPGTNSQNLGNSSFKWKDIYSSGTIYDTNNNNKLGDTTHITATTVSQALNSNMDYICDNAITSLAITGFTTITGDSMPIWSITFTAGTGISVSLPSSVKWANGDQAFSVGYSYKITFTQGINSTYIASCLEIE